MPNIIPKTFSPAFSSHTVELPFHAKHSAREEEISPLTTLPGSVNNSTKPFSVRSDVEDIDLNEILSEGELLRRDAELIHDSCRLQHGHQTFSLPLKGKVGIAMGAALLFGGEYWFMRGNTNESRLKQNLISPVYPPETPTPFAFGINVYPTSRGSSLVRSRGAYEKFKRAHPDAEKRIISTTQISGTGKLSRLFPTADKNLPSRDNSFASGYWGNNFIFLGGYDPFGQAYNRKTTLATPTSTTPPPPATPPPATPPPATPPPATPPPATPPTATPPTATPKSTIPTPPLVKATRRSSDSYFWGNNVNILNGYDPSLHK